MANIKCVFFGGACGFLRTRKTLRFQTKTSFIFQTKENFIPNIQHFIAPNTHHGKIQTIVANCLSFEMLTITIELKVGFSIIPSSGMS